jgi:hypothetical protein
MILLSLWDSLSVSRLPTFLNSRIGKSEVQIQQLNTPEFYFIIIIKISAQIINNFSKIWQNKK